MLRTVILCTCPKCGSNASILTCKHSTVTERAIYCANTQCRINTGWTFSELPELIRRWNRGIGLEHSNGLPFIEYDKHRQYITQVVDV